MCNTSDRTAGHSPPTSSFISRIRQWFSQHSPPGLPGGKYSTKATAPHDVPSPTGLRPYPPRGGISANIRSQKPTATAQMMGSVRGNGTAGIKPAIEPREGESRKRRVAKQTPGPMSGVAMTGKQGREPRTTEQPLGESSLNIQPRLPTWRQHGSPSPVQDLSSKRRTLAAVAAGGKRPPLSRV